jgi:hypothetical protein
MAKIRSAAQGVCAGERALTSEPGASAIEGASALTERAQRQGAWALIGGLGRQARVREPLFVIWAVRWRSDGEDQTEEGQTAAGGAAPLRGGGVAGVGAGVS